MIRAIRCLCTALFVSAATTASADVWHFESFIDQSQVIPPTGSDATGYATVRYDDVTNKMDIDVYVEGIAHEEILYGHLHVGRVGFYGDVILHLGHQHMWMPDGDGLRSTILGADIDEQYEFELLNDGCYIFIHTIEWKSGEIRGQVLATPRLTHTTFGRGLNTVVQASRVQPGERVHFVYSNAGLGESRPIVQLGGTTLDLMDPLRLLGSAVADDTGIAMLNVRTAQGAPLSDLNLQAVVRRGAGGAESIKSNTATTVIVP